MMVQESLVLRTLLIKRHIANRGFKELPEALSLILQQLVGAHPLRSLQKCEMPAVVLTVPSRTLVEAICCSREFLYRERHSKIETTLLAGSVVHGYPFISM